MMAFGGLFVLLVIGVVAYAGGWRPQFGQGPQPAGPAAPDSSSYGGEILRERDARGEIARDEYNRMQQEVRD